MGQEFIDRIREIRGLQSPKLVPSPYLREKYINDFGDESTLEIRDYQKIGVMNLLVSPYMCLCDSTGLGKTIEILTAIGYIWMKEPEYVPIIITTKSALFQWRNETLRFLKDMIPIVVHGEPYERHQVYEEFFQNYDINQKKLLILTYDHIMYDMDSSVIKDKTHKPRAGINKEIKLAKEVKMDTDLALDTMKQSFEDVFQGCTHEFEEYAGQILRDEIGKTPYGWSQIHQEATLNLKEAKAKFLAANQILENLKREKEPPKRVPGILEYVQEFKKNHPESKLIIVFDEIHKCKNHQSQFHQKCKILSLECQRIYGLTATPIQNRLMEFFSIFRIIKPDLFPKISHFHNDYCHIKLQPIGMGRKVPIVIGYKNLDIFVKKIEPYYLSRKKHEVAEELPQLISREVECELTDLQEELYDMAETGLLDKVDDSSTSNAELLSSMVMCQQAVNAPNLILNEEGKPFEGPSSKIDELLNFLDESPDQKVIVFSRFEKMISLVESVLNKNKILNVRITGKENDPRIREQHKNTFQDSKSGVNVILITTAGSESINLHAAEHFIFLDAPWSYGQFEQLIGRMIRIGSIHKTVVAHHFMGKKRDGKKTIDYHVLKALRSKKKLSDTVSGVSTIGGLSFIDGDAVQDIIALMRQGDAGALAKISEKVAQAKQKKAKSKPKTMKETPPEPIAMINIDISDL